MRRVVFSVEPDELEDALDGLLPRLVRGVRDLGGGHWAADGTELSREELEQLAGRHFGTFREEDLQTPAGHDEPVVEIGGRVVIRAPHQRPPRDGLADVVVERRGSGFGSGDHPTTRLCLELLLELEPAAGLADLGCGIGTLAIAGAKLGWSDIVGIDRDAEAVETAIANAARNDVDLDLTIGDLLQLDVPYRPVLLINAPPEVHHRVAEGLDERVREVVASSFMADEIQSVAKAYEDRGLALVRVLEDGGWAALRMSRDPEEADEAGPAAVVLAEALEPRQKGPKPPPRPVAELLHPDNAMRGGAAFGQLAGRLDDTGIAVSAARLVERGTRAAILYVPGLFRWDLTPGREAFGVTLRELCDTPMRWEADPGTIDGFRRGVGEPMIFRGGINLPDARLSVGLQALTAADEDLGAVHVVATTAVRIVSGQ
jgi:ribosomal protein L11 methyltransferase